MAKKNKNTVSVADMQPDELNALKLVVKDFITKIESIDNEIDLLKQDRKEVIEEFSDRLDIKTLNAALRIVKIQRGVMHKDAFDLFMAALEDPAA